MNPEISEAPEAATSGASEPNHRPTEERSSTMTVQPPTNDDDPFEGGPGGPHPVDSATRPCCSGIGGHTRECPENIQCAPWCTHTKEHAKYSLRADRNCWGADHPVVLHLEHHAPSPHLSVVEKMEMDPPRINPCAYRGWHQLPIVYLHLYLPDENPDRYLDTNLKLTTAEARELAANLLAVVDEIGNGQ